MTPQQIKDNAPHGATHYHTRNRYAIYYKIVNGSLKVYYKTHDKWYRSRLFIDDIHIKPL